MKHRLDQHPEEVRMLPMIVVRLDHGPQPMLTGDLKDFGPFMNQPEETFGILVQTVAEFLRARSVARSG